MRFLFLLAIIPISLTATGQSMKTATIPPAINKNSISLSSATGTEICDNNIDDDGNGLVDCKDFNCYFKPGDQRCGCYPMNLIWICDASRDLYWVDLQTQVETRVGNMAPLMGDIAWTPQGKLYGIDGAWIYEIDPSNANVTWVASLGVYGSSNAMVSDAAGNLFLSGISSDNSRYVLKYNLVSGQISTIANLSAAGVFSAGDLAFAGGTLYLACSGNKIAKINPNDGSIQVSNILGLPLDTQIFGIVSVASGTLYISDVNKLYSLDTTNFQATLVYTCSTPGINSYGMANYNDFCNAPRICNTTVNIVSPSSPPFCQNTSVTLKAEGAGVSGPTAYTWWKPDGMQENTQIVTAIQPGKYKVRYYTVPDTCEAWDTITIQFSQLPAANLGPDTTICVGAQLVLESKSNANATNWLWSDGSAGQKLIASTKGDYWLQLSNGCGISRDTIRLSELKLPSVYLGEDVVICPGEAIFLHNTNPKQTDERYLWFDGSKGDSLMVRMAGKYWLESTNACGKVADSIMVNMKDSCTCNPFYPSVQLGNDREMCKYDTLLLINFSGNEKFRYTWSDGSNSNTLVVESPGRYWVNVSTYCGTVTDTILIAEKQSGCECKVFVPNAFSPNGKSQNQRFRVKSTCYIKGELTIYNRWGQLLYHSSDLSAGWDGKFNSVLQQPGTFVFQLKYHFNNRPGTFLEKGTFILVR